jgi:hypothetical protein
MAARIIEVNQALRDRHPGLKLPLTGGKVPSGPYIYRPFNATNPLDGELIWFPTAEPQNRQTNLRRAIEEVSGHGGCFAVRLSDADDLRAPTFAEGLPMGNLLNLRDNFRSTDKALAQICRQLEPAGTTGIFLPAAAAAVVKEAPQAPTDLSVARGAAGSQNLLGFLRNLGMQSRPTDASVQDSSAMRQQPHIKRVYESAAVHCVPGIQMAAMATFTEVTSASPQVEALASAGWGAQHSVVNTGWVSNMLQLADAIVEASDTALASTDGDGCEVVNRCAARSARRVRGTPTGPNPRVNHCAW